MLYADYGATQGLLFLLLFLYLRANNLLLFWYVGGLYLLTLGLYGLAAFHDILIGFLWIIELGAGLIFFIFILHFTIFLYNFFFYKNDFFIYFYILFYFLFNMFIPVVSAGWFFYHTYVNWFSLFTLTHHTELYILYSAYFNWTWGEFLVINLLLLLVIFLCILVFFLFKYLTICAQSSAWHGALRVRRPTTFFFFRTQDFLKQQNARGGVRQWAKR